MRNTEFEKLNVLASFRGVLMALVASLAMTACTVYDNYDIELMQDPTAIEESSSSEASSSSKEKDTSYVIVIGGSSSSQMERYSSSAWPCGDSTMSRGNVEYETVDINGLNCEKFGYLYTFAAAEKVCPDDWRLLTVDDVEMMINYAAQYGEKDVAGQHFKTAEEWADAPGDNLIGFYGLPGGTSDEDAEFFNLYSMGVWWTSNEVSKDISHKAMVLTADNQGISLMNLDNEQFASVRCVRK